MRSNGGSGSEYWKHFEHFKILSRPTTHIEYSSRIVAIVNLYDFHEVPSLHGRDGAEESRWGGRPLWLTFRPLTIAQRCADWFILRKSRLRASVTRDLLMEYEKMKSTFNFTTEGRVLVVLFRTRFRCWSRISFRTVSLRRPWCEVRWTSIFTEGTTHLQMYRGCSQHRQAMFKYAPLKWVFTGCYCHFFIPQWTRRPVPLGRVPIDDFEGRRYPMALSVFKSRLQSRGSLSTVVYSPSAYTLICRC